VVQQVPVHAAVPLLQVVQDGQDGGRVAAVAVPEGRPLGVAAQPGQLPAERRPLVAGRVVGRDLGRGYARDPQGERDQHSGAVLALDAVHQDPAGRGVGKRAEREKLANLVALKGDAEGVRLPEKVDLALVVDTYHHIEERERYFEKLKRSLKPGGRVAIIDFRLEARAGPPKHTRIAPERVKSELAAAGYTLEQEHGFLPEQYFLVFSPRD